MIAILASFLISTNATARELVTNCRTMIPANVELSGRIILRNRKGIPQAEHDYVLSRSNAVTRLTVDGRPLEPSTFNLYLQYRRHLERHRARLPLVG